MRQDEEMSLNISDSRITQDNQDLLKRYREQKSRLDRSKSNNSRVLLMEMRKSSADSQNFLNTETDMKMDKLHVNIETLEQQLDHYKNENQSLKQTLVNNESKLIPRDTVDKKEYELLERKLDEKNEQLALLLKQKKNE